MDRSNPEEGQPPPDLGQVWDRISCEAAGGLGGGVGGVRGGGVGGVSGGAISLLHPHARQFSEFFLCSRFGTLPSLI